MSEQTPDKPNDFSKPHDPSAKSIGASLLRVGLVTVWIFSPAPGGFAGAIALREDFKNVAKNAKSVLNRIRGRGLTP